MQRLNFNFLHRFTYLFMCVIIISFATTSITAQVSVFHDLDDASDEATTIMAFYNRGLIKGYPDGTFRPSNAITRAEFVALINRTFQFELEDTNRVLDFSDLSQEAWYLEGLKIAVEQGYIQGYPDGTFRPQRNISRQEAAHVMNKILEYEMLEWVALDDTIQNWAERDVIALINHGIMFVQGNQFNAMEWITRGDTVLSLLMAIERIEYEAQVDEEIPESELTESNEYVIPADVSYAMQQTIRGLNTVLQQTNRFSEKLDATQLSVVVAIRDNMQSYLNDPTHDYEAQAKIVNVTYQSLTNSEKDEMKNAISYSVPYKYLKTLEKYFVKE